MLSLSKHFIKNTFCLPLDKLRVTKIKVIPMLFAFGILYACENDIQEVAALTHAKMPITKGTDVKLIYSEKADVKVKITAPLMEKYEGDENYTEMKKGIKSIFYDSLMNETSTLTSNYAIHYPGEGKMEVRNDVVVINEKGEQLNTEHLIWLQDSAIIFTDEFVKVTLEDEVLLGNGLIAAQDFSWFKILNPSGIVSINEEKPDSLNNNP